MKRTTARKLNMGLYGCLIAAIPALVLLQMQNRLLLGIVCVCLMFGICMVRLWISEIADRQEDRDMADRRQAGKKAENA